MTATLAPPENRPAAPAPRPAARWEYPALAAVLIGTAVSYLVNLSANGWANAFYAAAVQAGSRSWKAAFFGSSDAANSITVDKPPASLWVMELSVRLFGLDSWAMLVPQVLMAVATAALLWATVRRPFGPVGGVAAALVFAVTPVVTVMFRFNNPDALLVLLMVAAAWATTRAIADGRWRWLVLTGVFVGLGFLTKQLQVLLVVPPLALAYLVAGPPRLGKRLAQLVAAAAAMVASAGWWLLTVELWPADSRPWIGGSHENSIIELTLGYNGLGRLNGNERGSVVPGGDLPGGGGGGGGGGMWGSTGITRLFEPAQGGQIAWLLPGALVALVAGLVLCGRAARTDARRGALVLWGGWLLVTGLVFSYMAGIFHAYYTVALAPAVAALIGAGVALFVSARDRLWVRLSAALALGATTATAWILLSRTASFVPWLRWVILAIGVLVTIAIAFPLTRRAFAAVALAAAFVGLSGPIAYSVQTIGTGHAGAMPSAGPNAGGMHGFPRPGGDGRGTDARGDGGTRQGDGGGNSPFGGPGGGTMPGGGTAPGGTAPGGPAMPGGAAGPGDGREMGGMGGLLNAGTPSARVTALIEADSDSYTWVAAAVGANNAAGYQLATEDPVMPIGGFNGSDPSPTLEQFQRYVAEGRIHYFIGGGGGMRGGENSTSSAITAWVTATFTAREVDGATLYDLTATR
ncbi:glycosyltransferase family 39 protein [Nocardia thailandica]|uniref:Glycosyltransferase family 39 protein n=1 Tax=Nocardia thailandica TaxID=257275 RepID=A0ABW6PQJ8_9NOCA